VPWADLGIHLAALLLYPGALAILVLGSAAEAGAAWALVPERGGLLPAARTVLQGVRARAAAPLLLPPLAGAAALLVLLASTEVAAPFNPVPTAERNLLVAAVALSAGSWITWAWGWGRAGLDPRLLLAGQGCWLVSLLAPAIVPENLRPQVLGAIVVTSLLPLKLAAGVLYLLCLPALLQLLPEAAPQGLPGAAGRSGPGLEQAGFGIVRVLLWAPYCGLFTSLFFPPSTDDAAGVLRFLGISAGAAALAIVLAANLTRRSASTTRALYLHLVMPFAGFTLAVGVLSAVVV